MQTIYENVVREAYPDNSFISMGISIAKHHHERWDGKGYPSGLAMEEIPLSARIMAICDVYDALRSKRVYKESISHCDSIKIIERGIGTQFDPKIAECFLNLGRRIKEVDEKLRKI